MFIVTEYAALKGIACQVYLKCPNIYGKYIHVYLS